MAGQTSVRLKLGKIALDQLSDFARPLEAEPLRKAQVMDARLGLAVDHAETKLRAQPLA